MDENFWKPTLKPTILQLLPKCVHCTMHHLIIDRYQCSTSAHSGLQLSRHPHASKTKHLIDTLCNLLSSLLSPILHPLLYPRNNEKQKAIQVPDRRRNSIAQVEKFR